MWIPREGGGWEELGDRTDTRTPPCTDRQLGRTAARHRERPSALRGGLNGEEVQTRISFKVRRLHMWITFCVMSLSLENLINLREVF